MIKLGRLMIMHMRDSKIKIYSMHFVEVLINKEVWEDLSQSSRICLEEVLVFGEWNWCMWCVWLEVSVSSFGCGILFSLDVVCGWVFW